MTIIKGLIGKWSRTLLLSFCISPLFVAAHNDDSAMEPNDARATVTANLPVQAQQPSNHSMPWWVSATQQQVQKLSLAEIGSFLAGMMNFRYAAPNKGYAVNNNVVDLSDLMISNGSLTPVFAPGVTSYSVDVSDTVTSLQITAITADPSATLKINGQKAKSGIPATIALNLGSNLISITVKFENDDEEERKQIYTVNVTRTASIANADLSAISLSAGNVTPVFSAAVTSYSVQVANTVASVQVIATTADAGASVVINGQAVASGTASAPINLLVGVNTISVIVTAAGAATTKTTTINITRAVSSNADLSALSISTGTLNPAFTPGFTNYSVNVPNTVASAQFTAITADSGATLTINGQATASGMPSAVVALNVGTNLVSVVVTAADNVTSKTYTVSVTRAANSNADLSVLSASAIVLNPIFTAGTTAYSADVVNAVATTQVTAATADVGASVMINGQIVASGVPSAVINLAVGVNTINVIVTAADTVSSKVYTITINRAAASTNADLSALTIAPGTLTPVFATTTLDYTVQVDNTVGAIQITATTTDVGATLTINGQPRSSGNPGVGFSLSVGANVIPVVITAADTVTTKTYTLTVTRAASVNADLAALALSTGTLAPAFSATTFVYDTTVATAVTAVQVTATIVDSGSTLTVNGVATASGVASSPVNLQPGNNLITVVVTAADLLTKRTYSVNVLRQADTNLSALSLSVGTLSPVFDPAAVTYTAQVGFLASVVRVIATASSTSSTITVNGLAVDSGVASQAIYLAEGINPVNVVVTGVDGSVNTYTLSLTREALGTFAQRVYAKSSNSDMGDQFGSAVAIWGNTVAISALGESSGAAGVNGDPLNNTVSASGAVYVFVRDAAGAWSQQAYIKASNPGANDAFGTSLALWGDTLIVGAPGEDSSATGVNGNQADELAVDAGAAYVFVRDGAGVWTQQAYLKPSHTTITTVANTNISNDGFGRSVALWQDTIVVGASMDDSNAMGVNGAEDNTSATQSGAAYVFTRTTGTWAQQAYLKASNTQAGDLFGTSVAIYNDTIAVGAEGEDSAAVGINGNQADNGLISPGAVYVFTRDTAGIWAQQAYIKASNTNQGDFFGSSVALWGETLAVGAFGEDSLAGGINSDQNNNVAGNAGAVYVFTRSNTMWSQQTYIKASNPDAGDSFGYYGGVSLWENTLVVAAWSESSSATGVNGDQLSNVRTTSGAAYAFIRDAQGIWAQHAYIKASDTESFAGFGYGLGVWGDTLVSGAVFQDKGGRGINPPVTTNAANSGSSYFFK